MLDSVLLRRNWCSRQDGGKGGTYPGGWGSIGAVQGCPRELWTRLVGVMEIVATGGGATGSIATTTEVGDLGVHFPQNQKILLLLALQFSQHINPTHDIV